LHYLIGIQRDHLSIMYSSVTSWGEAEDEEKAFNGN